MADKDPSILFNTVDNRAPVRRVGIPDSLILFTSIRHAQNLELIGVVFIQKTNRDTHHSIIVARDVFCFGHFNRIMVIILWIFFWIEHSITNDFFVAFLMVKIGEPNNIPELFDPAIGGV